ncbi:sporulation protein YpjB [Paenibacillus sp. 481]|uniref:sporulation protein YpjB n=1 Tax=Paenibacillus sp. 481 TaxID=2835869 RepID=UPI001E5EE46E|nr:sporulation protein YpjB [Paenibacillus sp. 481]UHA72986.1 hypothetical protein KIK04_20635 [Paenibacillus sp. 481]
MRIFIAILIGFICLHGTGTAKALYDNYSSTPSTGWRNFDIQTDKLYRQVVAGDMSAAKGTMRHLHMLMRNDISKQVVEHKVSPAIEQTISEAANQVYVHLYASKRDAQKLIHFTARLKLAADALVHPQEALWLQYDTILREDLKQMITVKQESEWKLASQRWLEHLDRIRPAAAIQRSTGVMNLINSTVKMVEQSLQGTLLWIDVQRSVSTHSESWLLHLFGKTVEQTTFVPVEEQDVPLRWMFTLALIVGISLTYVAILKYRYERYAIYSHRFPKK